MRIAEVVNNSGHAHCVPVENWDDEPKRMVHEGSVFALRKKFIFSQLTTPEGLTVVRSVVKDNLAYVSLVADCSSSIASVQEEEFGSEAPASYMTLSAGQHLAARSSVAAKITKQHLNELNLPAKMQARRCMP